MLTSTPFGMPSSRSLRIRSGPWCSPQSQSGCSRSRRPVGLAKAIDGEAEQRALHGAGDGARIGHVLGHVLAAVDAGQDEVGLVVLHQVLAPPDARNRSACPSRRSACRSTSRSAQRVVADDSEWRDAATGRSRAPRPRRRRRAARAIAQQRLEARRVDAVVVGDRMRAWASSVGVRFFGLRDRRQRRPCRAAAPPAPSPSRPRSGSSPAPRPARGRPRGRSRSACARSACPCPPAGR